MRMKFTLKMHQFVTFQTMSSTLDLKMEADHGWNPEMRLQGCAGSLVVDMQQTPQKKPLANIIRLSTSKPLILAKPSPSQGLKSSLEVLV